MTTSVYLVETTSTAPDSTPRPGLKIVDDLRTLNEAERPLPASPSVCNGSPPLALRASRSTLCSTLSDARLSDSREYSRRLATDNRLVLMTADYGSASWCTPIRATLQAVAISFNSITSSRPARCLRETIAPHRSLGPFDRKRTFETFSADSSRSPFYPARRFSTASWVSIAGGRMP